MITQGEHIQAIKEANRRHSERTAHIQQLYLAYHNSSSGEDFEALLQAVDAYCQRRVRSRLYGAGVYTVDNYNDTIQNARISLWEALEKARSQGVIIENAAAFAYRIYDRRALDLSGKQCNEEENYDYIYIDEDVSEDGPSKMDLLPSTPGPEDTPPMEERLFFTDMFVRYCETLVGTDAFPPRSLALYYARVLPHMLPDSGVPDTKGASAKWAFIRMGERTVGVLSTDAECYLQANVSRHLKWCPEFYSQLYEKIEETGFGILGDVVYTRRYDKKIIEDWSESMHKTVTKELVRFIRSDRKLLADCADFISSRDRLYKLVFDENSSVRRKATGNRNRLSQEKEK